MNQPESMKTERYVYGVEPLNGHDAWAMFQACASGDEASVERLLAKDPRLVNAQYWYQFPIHNAVRQGHTAIVRMLLNAGADPGQSRFTYNSWDKLLLIAKERGFGQIEALLAQEMARRFGYSPEFESLKVAIISRQPARVEAVIGEKPELIEASDALGNNALHWSVLTRQLQLIERFAELGTPIDGQRADGQTPVLLSVNGATDYWYRETRGRAHPSLRNSSVITGFLLALGAEYSLSVAAAVGDKERVEVLLSEDPGLAKRLDSARTSPLSYAAREGHLHLVRLLLELGADPNAPEDCAPNGAALYHACCRNDLEAARVLLEHGADPNAGYDSSECCVTIGTIYHGRRAKPLQDLLRKAGAFTPPYKMSVRQLKQAVREGHPAVRHEEFLGCVMRTRNLDLLDLCLASDPGIVERIEPSDYPRSPALVRKLLACGLDPNRRDWLNKTFLHACAENGDRTCAALLIKAGADIKARDLEHNATPLERAKQLGHANVIELLKQHGASEVDHPAARPAKPSF